MKEIEILENMRDNIYGAMQFEDDYQISELEEKEFNALNSAITALKENQAYKDRIKELKEDRDTLRDLYWNCCIPKSFVKEKLEELDKQEKTELKGMKGQDRYAVKLEYQNKRSILQELLGEDHD